MKNLKSLGLFKQAKNYLLIFISLISLTFLNCTKKKEKNINAKIQANVLNYNFSPKHSFDKNGLMFSDQGAWFSYSISNDKLGFSGPFLLTEQNGIWSSNSLCQLIIKNEEFKKKESNAYPSYLEQKFESQNLEVSQKLTYLSGHTTLISTKIKNISNKNITINFNWKSDSLFIKNLILRKEKNLVKITSSKTNAIGYLNFNQSDITVNESNFYTKNQTIELSKNEVYETTITNSFIFPEYNWQNELQKINNSVFDTILKNRTQEKEKQLAKLFKTLSNPNDSVRKQLLTKTLLTLQNNWRIPAGEIKHEGLFPSYHYKWFNGFWSWDSWKHAVGLSYYDNKLAKEQIKLMFTFQNKDGYVADCVYRDTLIERHNYRDTKPPLSAWAVYKVFKQDGDISFLKEMYPKLKKYHEWWYLKRDHDKDKLCEYGSTDGSLVAAKWESGMDNAIRFDDSKILKNEDGAYSLNQESVDLNAYLFAEKNYLCKIASNLNLKNDSKRYKKEAEVLKKQIQAQFYSSEDGWFYDTSLDGKTFIKGAGSEGWTALWANAATQEQAYAVVKNMMNPKTFFTKVPFQTMSADHPKFDPLKGYWRGPNWLDQAYFGVRALRNYGFNSEAKKATQQILIGCEGLLDKGSPIRENYHPLTGKGLHAKNFSWSAAHIIMLLAEDQ